MKNLTTVARGSHERKSVGCPGRSQGHRPHFLIAKVECHGVGFSTKLSAQPKRRAGRLA